MWDFILIVISLLGIVGLIFLTYYASRWLNKKTYLSSGKTIKILERQMLSQDKYLAVVKVGTKVMMIGVSAQHIDKICDLDEADLSEYENNQSKDTKKKTFLENLKDATKQNPYIRPFVKNEENDDDR